jgi:hypothetical protein
MDVHEPPPAVGERWQALLEDAETTAAEYAADGYETLVVHPGDVTPVTGEPYGLDVLAPGDEFEALEELVEAATFDTSHVYYADEGGTRLLVVVVEGTADDGDIVVVVPAFLAIDRTPELARQATDEGVMYTHVRPLSDDSRVTFAHDDPSLFF